MATPSTHHTPNTHDDRSSPCVPPPLPLDRRLLLGAAGLAGIAALASGRASAGPLDPPAGPVTSTAKPLGEVEPRTAVNSVNTPGANDATASLYRITQPGSYYLTGNITGIPGRAAIEIGASNVTLDLMGFTIRGVLNSQDGIRNLGASNVTIRNGVVTGFGNTGVHMRFAGGADGTSHRIENIISADNGGRGITCGQGSAVLNCHAVANADVGIDAAQGSVIDSCTARQNGNSGIACGVTCTVRACTSFLNGTNGFGWGIAVSSGRVVDCLSEVNNSGGILVGSSTHVTHCVCNGNNQSGFMAQFFGVTFSGCTAQGNGGHGVLAQGVNCGTVSGCTCQANGLDGIHIGGGSIVTGNLCVGNGTGGDGAGIHVTGSGNRIEGNNCSSADRGIDVDAAGNIIVRNTCSGNIADWAIVANNVIGPIIDRRAPGGPAVNGFSSPGSLGSTDANANVSY